MIEKMKQMYTSKCDKEIVLLEGNIWEALKRIKRRALEDKKNDAQDNNDSDKGSSDLSWAPSIDENEEGNDQNTSAPKLFLRSTTYQQRKETAMHKIQNFEEQSVKISNEDSDTDSLTSDSDISNVNNERHNNFAEVKINVGTLSPKPKIMLGSLDDKKQEKETVKLVNEL